jgi:hypothetical protein
LSAQEADELYTYAVKIRAGLVGGDMQMSHHDNKIMGLGAEVKRKMFASGGALSAEVTWEVVPGRHHDVTDWGNTGPLVMEPYWSYDDRKERGEGFSLRVAYHSPIPAFGPPIIANITKKMEWFGGLGIDRYKVTSEFKWTLRDQSQDPYRAPYSGGVLPPLYTGGGGSFHEEGADVNIGIFAGINYRINSDLGFGVTLRNFGMKHYDFTPGAYSGSETGRLETGSSRGTAIEFALSLKL